MKNSKIIFILVLLGLIITFGFIFSRVNNMFSQIKEAREQVLILEKRAENIKNLEKSQDIIQKREEQIASVFVDLKTPVKFIGFLEQTIEENNLFFNINPQTVRKEDLDDWGSLRLQINLRGDFFNFINFLQEIEKAPFLLEILNITVQREQDLSEEVSASLLIKIFGKYE